MLECQELPKCPGEADTFLREATPGPQVSIVVPTFNERDNVAELLRRIERALVHRSWEVIFVDDDSPDGTSDIVRSLAAADIRVRSIQRIGRRGLSSACIEGLLATSGEYLAVIDADLQHDERLLPKMLDALESESADIVVGSRYALGGGIGDWDRRRALASRVAVGASRLLIGVELADPVSGFFMLRREVLSGAVRNLSAVGFKILFDIITSSPGRPRVIELPYQFGARQAGSSKFDAVSAWEFVLLLLDKLSGRIMPARFIGFSIVGSFGLIVHFTTFAVLLRMLHEGFPEAQTIATAMTMTFNFAVNNLLTYPDQRLRGAAWLRGWITFMLACSVGVLINVGLAAAIFRSTQLWFIAVTAGVFVSALWNYAATRLLTWGRMRR